MIAAALLTAGAMTTLPAAAAEDEEPARALPLRAQILFNLVDVNGDGAIDQTEIAALQRAVFVAIDVDGDGKLTAEEFGKVTAGPRERMARFGQWMGRGGPRDGHHGPGFHRGPRDGRQGQLEMPGMPGAPDGGQMPQMPRPQLGEGETGQPDGVPGGEPRDFASLDTNGDGVVSAEEFAAGAPRLPFFAQ